MHDTIHADCFSFFEDKTNDVAWRRRQANSIIMSLWENVLIKTKFIRTAIVRVASLSYWCDCCWLNWSKKIRVTRSIWSRFKTAICETLVFNRRAEIGAYLIEVCPCSEALKVVVVLVHVILTAFRKCFEMSCSCNKLYMKSSFSSMRIQRNNTFGMSLSHSRERTQNRTEPFDWCWFWGFDLLKEVHTK